MTHVKTELLKRLRKATDWLVSSSCGSNAGILKVMAETGRCHV